MLGRKSWIRGLAKERQWIQKETFDSDWKRVLHKVHLSLTGFSNPKKGSFVPGRLLTHMSKLGHNSSWLERKMQALIQKKNKEQSRRLPLPVCVYLYLINSWTEGNLLFCSLAANLLKRRNVDLLLRPKALFLFFFLNYHPVQMTHPS